MMMRMIMKKKCSAFLNAFCLLHLLPIDQPEAMIVFSSSIRSSLHQVWLSGLL